MKIININKSPIILIHVHNISYLPPSPLQECHVRPGLPGPGHNTGHTEEEGSYCVKPQLDIMFAT